MERLNCLRCAYRHEDNGNCTATGGFCTAVPAAHCRLLQEYLVTGLTPEEIERIVDAYGRGQTLRTENAQRLEAVRDIGTDRLRELAEADRDGRLVVLPCKVGDTVYWAHNKTITRCRVYRVQKNHKGIFICLRGDGKSYGAFLTDLTIGKTIFLTREEAEKALRRQWQ